MQRYAIDGKKIAVAFCRNCGHEVGISSQLKLKMTNIEKLNKKVTRTDDTTNETRVNTLMLLDMIMECCDNRDYSFWRDGEWIN